MNTDHVSAYRTLCQCTLGPNKTDIEDFLKQGSIENWVEHQTRIPRTSWDERYHQDKMNSSLGDGPVFATSWTGVTLDEENKDILRQRVAYILTQLFVVSTRDPALSQSGRRSAFCKFYDGLSERAFGNFDEIIKFVSTSPVMGEYLTFINNTSNEATDADENYARELLQLFTLGPVKLEGSGVPSVDGEGNQLPAYTQEDIEQLAKVFTGWKFAEGTSGHDRYMSPLRVDESDHNRDTKVILGKTFQKEIDAEEELDDVIRHLMNQANLYTYITYFFISKMITSNPMPGHVRRVRNAFLNSGGNVQALITAILTDQVADNSGNDVGKVRDPLIVFTHAMRALDAQLSPGVEVWSHKFNWYDRMLPMSAPSVFYYYQHDDAPSDPDLEGLFAPEFNIYNWSDIYQYGKEAKELLGRFHHLGEGWGIDDELERLHWADTSETDEELVELYNQKLFSGQMKSTTKQACIEFLAHCPRNNKSYYADIRALIMNLIISPEFIIQR
ncbi:DUF1800 domain-containing protein [Vibrio sp. ZSDE26]|uniref:DUF1800 domain-containing protein n=1 Tax=Vibrio amylolyticus TaxID=2847292 RepID=A0A9X1XJE0_9VIBR|nr:DUF1800 family protein [Vibrio amylolyticus]MCK6263516.1 DUF1800 domain-containing protein [Vibrio amylolyticus]